jgi:hypothetical protein
MDTTSVNGTSSPNANEDQKFYTATFRKATNDVLSGINAVTCYQPFRYMATQFMRNEPITFSPKQMYRGFIPQLFTAHQLMVMGFTDQMISHYLFHKENNQMSYWELLFKGSLAGISSAPTVTPFEAWNIRKQSDALLKTGQISMRGFTATLLRNWGVGLGIFAFPEIFKRQVAQHVPQEYVKKHPIVWNVCCSALGGLVATVCTQIPDTARVKMQASDISLRDAFDKAMKEAFTQSGKKAFACRTGILVVATVVMNQSRSFYEKIL